MAVIIAPVRSAAGVLPLIDHGAGELYTGVLYQPWEARYGRCVEFNRRGSYGERANPSLDELDQMLSLASSRNVRMYLTVNALQLNEEQADFIQPLLHHFAESGGFGVIISDYGLISRIKAEGLKVVLSSCAEVRNHYSAQFWQRSGCDRIILPRHISVTDIQRIQRQVPECEYEVFLMNSGCRMIDGFCRGTHHPRIGAMCDFCSSAPAQWLDSELSPLDEDEAPATLIEAAEQHRHLLRRACGMCALHDLKDSAVSFKVVGRVADEGKILQDVALARYNLEAAQNASCRAEYFSRMKYPNHTSQCASGMNCYYPEVREWR